MRDAHVALPKLTSPYTSYWYYAFPERNLDIASAMFVLLDPSHDDDGELDVYAVWIDEIGNETREQRTISLDGMTPYDFYLKLASSAWSLPCTLCYITKNLLRTLT